MVLIRELPIPKGLPMGKLFPREWMNHYDAKYGSVKLVQLSLPLTEWLKRFSDDLEIITREQNISNKRTEIELFDWFIERIKTRVGLVG